MKYRLERDSLGEVRVPAERLWGAQTQRSLDNFPIGPRASMPKAIIRAFAYIKKACALSNHELGLLARDKMELIVQVADEIIMGRLDGEFPLVIWQTGSGTHTNMNLNEVIRNRAHLLQGRRLGAETPLLRTNDDVNLSQSSNDTFPSAMHMAAYSVLNAETLPALREVCDLLQDKEKEFKEVIKIGRTHWMDATPITLGQEFSGYHRQLELGLSDLKAALTPLEELALGATAVGTGLNAPEGFDRRAIGHIAELTGLPFRPAANKFAAIAAHESLIRAHAALKGVAVSLMKIGNDIRAMASGPRSGIGELNLPANEPGSSIMPGKVNPSQIEALTMVCAQVMGNDTAIAVAGAGGHFELNVFKPLIIANFLQSAQLLADVCRSFNRRCLLGITANKRRVREHLERSLMLVTALTPRIGYENAAKIAQAALKNHTTLEEEAEKSGLLSRAQCRKWLKASKMLGPRALT